MIRKGQSIRDALCISQKTNLLGKKKIKTMATPDLFLLTKVSW